MIFLWFCFGKTMRHDTLVHVTLTTLPFRQTTDNFVTLTVA